MSAGGAARAGVLLLIFGILSGLPVHAAETAHVTETPPRNTLKLATWNLEWLIAPEELRALEASCAPKGTPIEGRERRIPCDVAQRFERSNRDFQALARYAKRLDADVIALQEVDGPAAARLVFPGYKFCFTGRPHPQNNGFAIRAGLRYRCGPDLTTLSRRDALRRGAEVVLFPGEPREIHLLGVHLKSGCSRDPLTSGDRACEELSRQVPALEAWIDSKAQMGKRFAVLGDFNRELLRERGPARSSDGRLVRMWPALDDGVPSESDLVNAAEGARFRSCIPGQPYDTYIDFIILSRTLGAAMVPGSFERLTFTAREARRSRLSDHCPVAITVRLESLP